MIDIIPAILTNKIKEVSELLKKAEGVVDRVHIDVIDGVFVDNSTVNPEDVSKIKTDLYLDFHLMVDEPINWVTKAADAGADRIIAQIEMMEDQRKFVSRVKSKGALAGFAIGIDTPISEIDEIALSQLDVILIMSVPAGFGGQEFDDSTLTKIKQLQKLRENIGLNFVICCDGGITLDNIASVYLSGADEASVGRRIFEGNLKKNIIDFTSKAESAHEQKNN